MLGAGGGGVGRRGAGSWTERVGLEKVGDDEEEGGKG